MISPRVPPLSSGTTISAASTSPRRRPFPRFRKSISATLATSSSPSFPIYSISDETRLTEAGLLVLQERIEEAGELRLFADGLLFVACSAFSLRKLREPCRQCAHRYVAGHICA